MNSSRLHHRFGIRRCARRCFNATCSCSHGNSWGTANSCSESAGCFWKCLKHAQRLFVHPDLQAQNVSFDIIPHPVHLHPVPHQLRKEKIIIPSLQTKQVRSKNMDLRLTELNLLGKEFRFLYLHLWKKNFKNKTIGKSRLVRRSPFGWEIAA